MFFWVAANSMWGPWGQILKDTPVEDVLAMYKAKTSPVSPRKPKAPFEFIGEHPQHLNALLAREKVMSDPRATRTFLPPRGGI